MSKDAQLLLAMGMGPDERPDLWWKAGTPQAHVRDSLGLNLDPSEWTVEHDANFARVVWPWLRENCKETHLGSFSQRCLQAIDRLGYEHTALWVIGCPHPGPTMCQAIYSVLCGEDGK